MRSRCDKLGVIFHLRFFSPCDSKAPRGIFRCFVAELFLDFPREKPKRMRRQQRSEIYEAE